MAKKIIRDFTKRYGKWLRMDELPFGRTLAYKLIEQGLLFTVTVGTSGSKRGVRLVSAQSLDDYLKNLAQDQKSKK